MTLFLTSSPCQSDGSFNPANGFLDRLRAALPACPRCLFVCSSPDDFGDCDYASAGLRHAMELACIPYDTFETLDRRTQPEAARLIAESDFIIFAGGHVPTQNRFYQDLDLTHLIRRFTGVAMGISAGSMNCARRVYSIPEHEGEARSLDYRRWLTGLALTERQIIPHYHSLKGVVLDGLRMFEEIAYPDSMQHQFTVLPDGSYVLREPSGEEHVYGEAYLLANGFMSPYTRVSSQFYL